MLLPLDTEGRLPPRPAALQALPPAAVGPPARCLGDFFTGLRRGRMCLERRSPARNIISEGGDGRWVKLTPAAPPLK